MEATTQPLPAGYRQRIGRDGFALVRNVLGSRDIARLIQSLESVSPGAAVRQRRNVYGIRNLLEVCPAIRSLAKDRWVRTLIEPILGPRCFAVRGLLFNKTPDANWNLGWHQDSVIAVRERKSAPGFGAWSLKAGVHQVQPTAEVLSGMLALRLHLDDCGPDDGPLRVLPGTHDQGWLDDRQESLIRTRRPVVCEARAGDVLVMRPMLLHASRPARSPDNRRVVHIEFAAEDLPFGLHWDQRIGPE
ncbi:MAG: phytanoyl-CoA dioxygenase family protein [Phycisphaeraceae bacterium]|nr:phytanoyl-CoA dioxygenase family protein [Phycisphaeraceae bacterium]